MIQFLNPIKIIVLLTFLVGLLFLNYKNSTHFKLLCILFICFINEYVALILKYKDLSIDNLFNVNILIHNSLWIFIIGSFFSKKYSNSVLVVHLIFCVINMFFFEGYSKFDYYSFVFGALLYTVLFIYLSFIKLKNDDLFFFQSNIYILMFAPVLFFLGLSFMFSFKSKELTSTEVFFGIKLYKFINYFVNIFYYFFINLYIFKEKKKAYV